MRYEDEPLGCFQQVSYGLIGVGLYVFCSVFSCLGLMTLIWQLKLNGVPNPNSEFSFPSLWDLGGVVLSFLCIGPVMIIMYVLYLEDIRVIEPFETAPSSPQPQRNKEKHSALID